MTDLLPPARLQHVAAKRKSGDAAHRVLSADDFATARTEITAWDGYAPTPLVSLSALAAQIGVGEIQYKHEGPRFGLGSFKALGGSYAAQRVLQREVARRTGKDVSLADIRTGAYADEVAQITLVSATDGNHGRSLAWGCQRFGAPCRIYIHAEVSEGRAAAMRDYGADVVRIDGDYDDSVRLAKTEAEENDWFVVSDTSWPGYSAPPRDVMAGYGVMAREIFAELAEPPTHVFLQAACGGFAGGIVAAFRQHWGAAAPRVVIVESDYSPCLLESARAGALTNVPVAAETIMAGLSCGEPSPLAWGLLAEEVSDFVSIPDSFVGPTMRLLARPLAGDPAVEGGECSAAGLAALIAACRDGELAARLGLDGTSRVLLFGTEGITDAAIYGRIMEGWDGA